jgi:hypothetical protein
VTFPQKQNFLRCNFSHFLSSYFQAKTPVCMFYFSHPFGISTPSSANNIEQQQQQQQQCSKKAKRKGSKYTTTTYLVTEIQKNHSDGSQDESDAKKNSFADRELLPWPKNFLLPPLVQLIEKKHGRYTFFSFLYY